MSKEYPWGKGTPTWVRDATANDSDKSFTVPTGKLWCLKAIEACLTCTATVGNRVLSAVITNGVNQIHSLWQSASITASQVGVVYGATSLGTPSTTASRKPTLAGGDSVNVAINDSLPDMVLPAGYVIRVYDSAAIDPAADDLIVVLHYVEYDA